MLSKTKRLVAVLIAAVIAALSVMPVSAGIEHMIIHQPTTNEPYVTVTNSFSASYQWYTADLDDGEEFTAETQITPVEEQTSSALTATPDGKKYVCEIVWSDGVRKMTDIVTNSYVVTHQPTASEPYVALNNPSGATFQWHRSKFSTVTVTESDGAGTLAVSTVWSGSYADGLWHGTADTPVDIEFELKENQLLNVTPSAGFDGTVEEYGEAFLHSQSGTYTYLASEDIDFNLCIEGVENFSAKIEILTFTNSSPVSNQTGNTLTADADSTYYFCEITGNGNAKLSTQSFRFDVAVTHQPDAKEPYVEINTSKAATYSWFETSETTYKLVNIQKNENELEIYDLWVGSFKDNKWHSNPSGIFEGQVLLRKGQTLSLALPDNFVGGVGGLRVEDGVYTYTAETNEKFYVYLKNPTPFAFDLYVTELKNEKEITELNQKTFTLPVDGKTYRCAVSVDGNELLSEAFINSYAVTHQPSTDEPYVETNSQNTAGYQWYKLEKKLYDVVDSADAENETTVSHIYKGIFSDGLWLSQNGRLDIELNLKKNDVVLVDLSNEHKCYVSVNENDLSFSGEAFTFIAPQNGLFNLIVASSTSLSSFTADIKVLRGVKGSALNGTDSTLNAISNGHYLCAVTFADGTVEESNPVIIADGSLDALEKEYETIAKSATQDDTEKIMQISAAANKLVSASADETSRIKAITDGVADLLALITQKSNAVASLTAAVEEFDVDRLIPSDKNDLNSIKVEISALLDGKNLTQSQKDTLTALLDVCDELIEIIDNLNITVSIINNPQRTQIKFGQTITLSATATDMPEGAKIAWYVGDELAAEGETFDFTPEESSVVTVKILDENGSVILDKDAEEISDTEQIDVKSNFFIKLINFFKKLFRINQTIVQTII